MPNVDGERLDFGDFKDILQLQDIEGLQDGLNNKAALSHTHAQSEVTGLDTALGSKAPAVHDHAFLDLTDAPADFAGDGLSLVRVNAAEDALEFIPPSAIQVAGSLEVGDILHKLRRKPAPSTGQNEWLPAWEDAEVDAGEWPDLQPYLYGVKAEIVESITDQFLVVSVSRAANVASLVLANTEECQLFCDLLYRDLLFNCYDPNTDASTVDTAAFLAWAMTIDLPDAIDFIPAGRYQLTGLNAATRTLSFGLTGANQGATAVTEYLECWPYRKAGSSSVCFWRGVTDAGLTMGRIPGFRSLDAVGKHKHSYTDFYTLGATGEGGGAQISTQTSNTGDPSTGRTDTINRTRSIAGFLYIFAGEFV
jgi:hypothetical protein